MSASAEARLRVAVLASGRGSNFAALLAARRDGRLDADIVGLVSDRASAGALTVAKDAGVPFDVVRPQRFDTRTAFEHALFERVDALAPGLIVCAGFMRVLGTDVVAPRSQRMINIHPSLLPAYTGLDTHRRVLDAGDAEHGASVHFVIPALDAGPVIAQTRIRVEPGDDPDALAARLLPAEHRLLVATVALFCRHRITHAQGRVLVDGTVQEVPRRF